MTRTEADKEDLMTDAVAMIHRVEFGWIRKTHAASWTIVTMGFRADDSFSIYLDQNPFYQFDASGRLRRAHVDGDLYRSGDNILSRLHRTRSETQTTLHRHDLTNEELAEFRANMRHHLSFLQQSLQSADLQVLRCVSSDSDLTERIQRTIEHVLSHKDDFLAGAICRRA